MLLLFEGRSVHIANEPVERLALRQNGPIATPGSGDLRKEQGRTGEASRATSWMSPLREHNASDAAHDAAVRCC